MPLFRVSQNQSCPAPPCALWIFRIFRPLSINSQFASKGSFAGKAADFPQGHHLHVMGYLGLGNFWHCTKNSSPDHSLSSGWCPEWDQDWISSFWGRKEEQSKDENFICKLEVRTASVISYHCSFLPLLQTLLAFVYRHFGMKLLQRKMNFYCQQDTAKWNITLCAFMFIHHCLERPLQSLKVTLISFNIWEILIY